MNLIKSSPSDSILILSTLNFQFENSPPPITNVINPSNQKPVSFQSLGMYRSPVINALWLPRSKIYETVLHNPSKDKEDDDHNSPQHDDDFLLSKSPSQSRTSVVYDFSSDNNLREHYRDPWNEFRIGKLLEDLDALASTIALKHCLDDCQEVRPLLLVTASVDKIMLKRPISVEFDIQIVGNVIWVGRSSMEIQLEVIQPSADDEIGSDSVVLTAHFIFVACDAKTGKATQVNKLSPQTQEEMLLFKEAEAKNKQRRKKKTNGSEKNKFLETNEIENDNKNKLKSLLAKGWVFCDMPALADKDSILVSDTRLESSLVCQPQHRNMHGRIFGGFLMHRAFELAFSTAYAFAGSVPCFLEVDHIDFLRPVDVGDFLRFRSSVLYTRVENPNQPLINVEVVAHVTRPELRSAEVSNTFYFTFTVRPEAKAAENEYRIRTVVPSTEEEARRILERMDAEVQYS